MSMRTQTVVITANRVSRPGPQGAVGPPGPQGLVGPSGGPVPAGGVNGQVVMKDTDQAGGVKWGPKILRDQSVGRLSISGLDNGDTGTWDVSQLLHADWKGTDSKLYVERIGPTVNWYLNLVKTAATGDPANTLYGVVSSALTTQIPLGFRALPFSAAPGANDQIVHTHGSDMSGGSVVRPMVVRVLGADMQVQVGYLAPDNFPFVRGKVSTPTADPWPATDFMSTIGTLVRASGLVMTP